MSMRTLPNTRTTWKDMGTYTLPTVSKDQVPTPYILQRQSGNAVGIGKYSKCCR